MRRYFVAFSVMTLGLLLGGAIAGWPSRVKSDVVIERVTSTSQPAVSTTVAEPPADATTLPIP